MKRHLSLLCRFVILFLLFFVLNSCGFLPTEGWGEHLDEVSFDLEICPPIEGEAWEISSAAFDVTDVYGDSLSDRVTEAVVENYYLISFYPLGQSDYADLSDLATIERSSAYSLNLSEHRTEVSFQLDDQPILMDISQPCLAYYSQYYGDVMEETFNDCVTISGVNQTGKKVFFTSESEIEIEITFSTEADEVINFEFQGILGTETVAVTPESYFCHIHREEKPKSWTRRTCEYSCDNESSGEYTSYEGDLYWGDGQYEDIDYSHPDANQDLRNQLPACELASELNSDPISSMTIIMNQ